MTTAEYRNCYIVLFPDETLKFFASEVSKLNFQKGSRIFRCKDEVKVISICAWIGNNYKDNSLIKEIK